MQIKEVDVIDCLYILQISYSHLAYQVSQAVQFDILSTVYICYTPKLRLYKLAYFFYRISRHLLCKQALIHTLSFFISLT